MSSINNTVIGERLLRVIERRRDRLELNRLEESVGDLIINKDEDSFRLISQNINGFGQEADNTKEIGIKNFAIEFKADILALQQMNVCWSKVSNKNKIWERFRNWEECYNLSVAYNKMDKNTNAHQPGGVALLSKGKIAHTWVDSGVDKEMLGRWTWMRYQGSCGRHMRVVSVYRPCWATQRVNSLYMKQYGYSLEKRNGVCPRVLFLQDLEKEIKEWSEIGDSIIVMGDFNQDVRSKTFIEWRDNLGLEDRLIERVEKDGVKLNTYNGGHAPIDSILCTNGVKVIKAGYLPFGEGVGDHRPIFVDITIASTLGVNLPNPLSVKARRLKTNDPRITKRYNKILKAYFRKYNLGSRVTLLQDKIKHPLEEEDANEFERLDNIRMQGMVYAERRCRKLKMGAIPWTPELSRIRNAIEVWQLVRKRMKGYQISARTIIRKKAKARMSEVETNVPLSFVNSQLRIHFKQYKEYLMNAAEKRQGFQDQLAQARAAEGNKSLANEIEKIKQVEAQRESAKRIRRMNGTLRTSKGLSKVVVPKEDGTEIELIDKEEMERALLEAYEKTLTQSNRTPCMSSPLVERLGLSATKETAHNVLHGYYFNEEGIEDTTIEVLKYLEFKEGTKQIFKPKPLNVPECKIGWGKAKERTSSSMRNGTHFGHWITGYLDHEIATIHTGLANIPYMSGYSPKRWQTGTNAIIQKETGNYKINRLRTILLYEADFNFNNKILAIY